MLKTLGNLFIITALVLFAMVWLSDHSFVIQIDDHQFGGIADLLAATSFLVIGIFMFIVAIIVAGLLFIGAFIGALAFVAIIGAIFFAIGLPFFWPWVLGAFVIYLIVRDKQPKQIAHG